MLYGFFKTKQNKKCCCSHEKTFRFLSLALALSKLFFLRIKKKKRKNSKVEPASPRSLGQRLDPPVVHVAPAVERHLVDVGGLAELGDPRADELGRARVPPGGPAELLPDLRGQRRRGDERGADGVVDDLGVDVVVGAEDGEARPLGLALELIFFCCCWVFCY